MSRSSLALREYVAVGVTLTVATMSIAAIYFSNEHRKHRRQSRLRSWSEGKGGRFDGVDARRYPYVRAKGGVPTPTTAVRYGKDGRRRLFCGVDAAGNTGGDQAEVGGGIDPRERALASFDVLLAVFSFIDSRDVMACGETCVALREAATDDLIWINYTKRLTARLLTEGHIGADKERQSDAASSFLLQAGLGRVMDLVYAQLPRAYAEIYPGLPPTRQLPAPRRAHMSWHRLWLTMAWTRRTQFTDGVNGSRGRAAGRASLALGRESHPAIDTYGTTAFFPEQVLSFVSFLFSSCCTDYWDELIQHTPEGESSTVPEKRERVSAPEWGDMLSVLRGYLRLYQGRRFVNLKDNMGFLLHDPETAGNTTSGGHDDIGGDSPEDPPSAPKRELQIPCTHRALVQTLENPMKHLKSWPYAKQLTLDGLMAEFAT